MGFCYQGRRLCCDKCGAADGTVRKRKCPHGYCPSFACCKSCWDSGERERNRAYHVSAGCKEKHEHFEAQRREAQAMVDAGTPLRFSAVNDGAWVKVWFRSCKGEQIRWMASETYQAIPLLTNATITDFEAHGPVYTEPQ